MIFNKEYLEQLKKEGEQHAKKLEIEKQQKINGLKYKVGDIHVTCVHCNHDKFRLDHALLNTRGMTFLGWEWLNDGANTLTCTRCGFIHWFAKEVTKIDE